MKSTGLNNGSATLPIEKYNGLLKIKEAYKNKVSIIEYFNNDWSHVYYLHEIDYPEHLRTLIESNKKSIESYNKSREAYELKIAELENNEIETSPSQRDEKSIQKYSFGMVATSVVIFVLGIVIGYIIK